MVSRAVPLKVCRLKDARWMVVPLKGEVLSTRGCGWNDSTDDSSRASVLSNGSGCHRLDLHYLGLRRPDFRLPGFRHLGFRHLGLRLHRARRLPVHAEQTNLHKAKAPSAAEQNKNNSLL